MSVYDGRPTSSRKVRYAQPIVLLGLLGALCLASAFATQAVPTGYGTWTSIFTVDPGDESLGLKVDVTAGLEFALWDARTRTVFDRGGWQQQNFTLIGEIGRLDVKSDLRLEPHLHRFRDWATRFRWRDDGLTVTVTPQLTRTTNWFIAEVDTSGSLVEMGGRIRWRAPTGSCKMTFHDARLTLSGTGCGIDAQGSILLDARGFRRLEVELSGLAWDGLPWVSCDIEIVRTLTGTDITFRPDDTMTLRPCDGDLRLVLTVHVPDLQDPGSWRLTKAVATWRSADWKVTVTALPEPAHWIRKTYWLESKATGTFRFDLAGSLIAEFEMLWTETAAEVLTFALTRRPTPHRSFALGWAMDLPARKLQEMTLSAQIRW